MMSNSNINISNSNFTHIEIYDSSPLHIADSDATLSHTAFSHNHVAFGGGITLECPSYQCVFDITDCSFVNNVATQAGGGIYFTHN